MVVRTVLAVAAGGGGLERAVHRAIPGSRVVCYVEHEATAAGVLVSEMARGRLDEAPVWSDVHTFDARAWRGIVDIVTAGYPCQPFSVAGKRRGADDPRHLWPAIARIVRDAGPSLCIFENVPGHLRLGAREVVRDLQGMGYTTAATLWRAEEVGAPHRRERLFIAAVSDAFRRELRDEPGRSGGQGGAGAAEPRDVGEELVHAESIGRREGRPESTVRSGRDASARASTAVGDADEQGSQGRGESERGGAYQRPAWPPSPEDALAWQSLSARYPDLVPARSAFDELQDRVRAAGAPTYGPARDRAGRLRGPARSSGLSPEAQSVIRGVADGLAREQLSRADRLRILGNGVVPQQAEAAMRELLSALA